MVRTSGGRSVFNITKLNKIIGYDSRECSTFVCQGESKFCSDRGIGFQMEAEVQIATALQSFLKEGNVTQNIAGVKRNATVCGSNLHCTALLHATICVSGSDIGCLTIIDSLCAATKTVITGCYYTPWPYQVSPWPSILCHSKKRSARTKGLQ